MTNLDIIKQTYGAKTREWQAAIATAEAEKKKALGLAKDCDIELYSALAHNDQARYLEVKAKKQHALDIVEYYDAQIAQVKKDEAAIVESFKPLMIELYDKAMQEYKEACKECIATIKSLEAASDKAASIAASYDEATAFFRNYIEHSQTVLGGAVPSDFPNRGAVALTRNLRFQMDTLEQFINAR